MSGVEVVYLGGYWFCPASTGAVIALFEARIERARTLLDVVLPEG